MSATKGGDKEPAAVCGVCGVFHLDGVWSGPDPAGLLERMAGAVAHRGPDGEGTWCDPAAGIGFAHRRLAIVDVSDAGRQPMASADGRWVITYNGEIYNHGELRQELAAGGVRFRGGSDTETLLEAIARWGVRPTLERLNGIFALGLWDRKERVLTLARDHLGVKPLYWGRVGTVLLFGSQPKSFRAWPGFEGGVDRAALAAYFRFGYVPTPATIHRNVFSLPPGTMLTVRAGGSPETTVYWDAVSVAKAGTADRLSLSDDEATDRLDALLRDAVDRQMMADVPLGAFLSGGIDSSTVVALMQSQSERPVRTFTIGFDEADFDEAPAARAVARHLGTDHTEAVVTARDALDLVPRLAEYYDQPFADSSQIPTLLVSAMTRRHVTVALSGDGGDELFAGYNRYIGGASAWRRLARLPRPLRRVVAGGIKAVPGSQWDLLAKAIPERYRLRQAGDKLHKLARVLDVDDAEAFYRRLVSLWDDPGMLVRGAVETVAGGWSGVEAISDPVERMQVLDARTYLPDDILTKVDRASMGVSLEARVPLLDPRVFAFAWRLPMHQKIRDGKGKWLLRQVLRRYVPDALIDRPKSGFALPLDVWLRGPLRDWAESLLDEDRLKREGFVEAEPVRTRWRQHLAGTHNHRESLWAVLMFQAWRERWDDAGRGPEFP